jgi:hypothetical protein
MKAQRRLVRQPTEDKVLAGHRIIPLPPSMYERYVAGLLVADAAYRCIDSARRLLEGTRP